MPLLRRPEVCHHGPMESTIQYSVSTGLQPGELGALLGSVGWGPYSREQLERIIAGSTAYITARVAGRLVGFGRLLSDGGTIAYINNMAVDPQHQRRGIGQAILDRLLEACRGVDSVYLYTNTADALYLRNGFRPAEKRLYLRRDPH